jgi:hypothetical protein
MISTSRNGAPRDREFPDPPFPGESASLAKPPSSPCRTPSLALWQHLGAQRLGRGLCHPEIPDAELGRTTDPAFSLSRMLGAQLAQ